MEARGEQSEVANSLRTSLAKLFELVATGGMVRRGGESILCSEDNLIDSAAESVESGKAGGYSGRRRHHQLYGCIENKLSYKTIYWRGYIFCLSLFLSTIVALR